MAHLPRAVLAAWVLTSLAEGGTPESWRAQWIWDAGQRSPKNAYLYARKDFVLPGRVEQATARVTADSRYRLYVNGQFVGQGPARCDPQRQFYATYDLRGALRPGQNAIAAVVHHYGVDTRTYVRGAAGFLLEADVVTAGHTVQIQTDETWRVARAAAWVADVPRRSAALGFIEVFDARREPAGWHGAAFDDFDWRPATVLGPPGAGPGAAALVPRPIPHLAVEEVRPTRVVAVGQSDGTTPSVQDLARSMASEPHATLTSCSVDAPEAVLARDGRCAAVTAEPGSNAFLVLDFGREVFGSPRVAIAASEGGILDLGYAETLTDGRVDPTLGGVQRVDRYVMRRGAQTWELFDQRAFRYLQLSLRGLPGPVRLDSVSLAFTSYPVKAAGSFRSSDPLLDRIWAVGAYTCRLCMQDAYIDCPSRDRAQWWGDARVEMLINAYAFGDRLLAAKGLQQLGLSQRPDGSILALYPAGGNAAVVLPDYSALWIMSLREHWWLTGDEATLRACWTRAQRLLEWFHRHAAPSGLLAGLPAAPFIDAARVDKAGECGALNAFYHGALLDAVAMARHLGDEAAASRYSRRAAALRDAFNRRLWDEPHRCYADARSDKGISQSRSLHTNTLAVLYGLADGPRKDAAADYAARLLRTEPVGQASPYFMHYVLEMLFREGRPQAALDAIRRSWKVMLDGGATTWWEHFHPRASWCHGWSATPTYHLPAWVVGIRPLSPGYSRLLIAPTLCDLAQAAATVPTPQGPVTVRARREPQSGSLHLEADVPAGPRRKVVATIALPLAGLAAPEVRLNEQLVWAKGKLTGTPPAYLRRAQLTAGRLELDLPGGRTYRLALSATAK